MNSLNKIAEKYNYDENRIIQAANQIETESIRPDNRKRKFKDAIAALKYIARAG